MNERSILRLVTLAGMLLMVAGFPGAVFGEPEISSLEVDPEAGTASVGFESDPAKYFRLDHVDDLEVGFENAEAVDMKLGVAGADALGHGAIPPGKGFYWLTSIALSTPLDYDGDGDLDPRELGRPGLFDPLDPADRFRHPNPNAGAGGELGIPDARGLSRALARGVDAHSGEVNIKETDLFVRGRVLDFAFTRCYRSRYGPDTVMGNGWDHGYNIFLIEDGTDLILHSGLGRSDRFTPEGGGKWTRAEFFGAITQNVDTSYTLIFPNKTLWHFDPIDGSPDDGKIEALEDRNGNTISFSYDGSGRLDTVLDDLGRSYGFTYNTNGFLESVSDFTGRTVQYEYYPASGDPDGVSGDLKSAATPQVTGTPNGNDFPAGKTTVYTYSTGLADEKLNHNLLTVTDPKGQTSLEYVYSTTTNVTDYSYDRVLEQTWGDPGEEIDFHYELVTPSPGNNNATTLTIINDRRGLVEEFYYDHAGRCVMLREFTGVAPSATSPTTPSANRPAGPLRPSDPAFFETQWDHNNDGLVTSCLLPNQNTVDFTYDSANADPCHRGDLLQIVRDPGPLGADQPALVEQFEYDSAFGGVAGRNFVTRHVDARGNETLHAYDAAGNRTNTVHRIPAIVEDFEYDSFGRLTARVLPEDDNGNRRRTEFIYYTSGPQEGYLERTVVDITGFALTTTYEYDARGNLVRRIDPRGNDTLIDVNQLDQPVRVDAREVATSTGPVRYQTDFFYDANDNVIKIDALNVDGDGNTGTNTHITTEYDYDALDRPIRVIREEDSANDIAVEYDYDANRNVTEARKGEAVSGGDPSNRVRVIYDERDLVFRVVRGEGAPEESANDYAYDGNRNLAERLQGANSSGPRLTTYEYDGYDRLTGAADPMGNERIFVYDSNGNTTNRVCNGESPDVPGDGGNSRLSETTYEYDAMDRRVRRDREHFDTATQTPIGDGRSTTRYFYDGVSQLIELENDNNHTVTFDYDTANRLILVTDPLGNERSFQYDANDNVIQVDETDKSDSGDPDQSLTTTYTYDGLDRATRRIDNAGNTNRFVYDSRDNVVETEDGRGNTRILVYDGLDRLTGSRDILTGTGGGGGGVVGVITNDWQYDDSSRLTGQTDGNGNTTIYQYDSLDRRVQVTRPDNTQEIFIYDVHDNRTQTTDANGTIVIHDYDLNDRRVENTVSNLAPGVSGVVTAETYEYDGLNRLVQADNDFGGPGHSVAREYDSLSNRTSETLDGQTTSYTYDGAGNRQTLVYPGGRTLDYTYDSLERRKTIDDSGLPLPVVAFDYVGLRLEGLHFANNTHTRVAYDGLTGVPNPPGDSGVKRVITVTHTNVPAGTILFDHDYIYDANQKRTARVDNTPGAPTERFNYQYTYDSIDRLVRTMVEDNDAPPNLLRDEQYLLDFNGNRTNVVGTGVANPGPYFLDPTLPNPADFQVDQYTQTSFDARLYDDNGNLIVINQAQPDQVTFTYDSGNRLVEVQDNGSGQVHQYQYDALGRRVIKAVDITGANDVTVFFYDGWRVIEEWDGAGVTQATYVCGEGVGGGGVLSMRRSGQDFFYHCDVNGHTLAITDPTGAVVVDRYEFGDFGQPLDPVTLAPVAGDPSTAGNPYLFDGLRYDPETELYYNGGVYFDPRAGRDITCRGSALDFGEIDIGTTDPFERLDIPDPKRENQVDIEMNELELKGVEPFEVDVEGDPSEWMVNPTIDTEAPESETDPDPMDRIHVTPTGDDADEDVLLFDDIVVTPPVVGMDPAQSPDPHRGGQAGKRLRVKMKGGDVFTPSTGLGGTPGRDSESPPSWSDFDPGEIPLEGLGPGATTESWDPCYGLGKPERGEKPKRSSSGNLEIDFNLAPDLLKKLHDATDPLVKRVGELNDKNLPWTPVE